MLVPSRQDGVDASVHCEHCSTDNRPGARFCKQCGASLAAPAACPACQTPALPTARFCATCGERLVGARPAGDDASAPSPAIASAATTAPAAPAAPAVAPVASVAPASVAPTSAAPITAPATRGTGAVEDKAAEARRELEALAASLPKAKPRGSNIVGNVLLFVAALAVFVVFMYQSNKNAPKEISPFQGGPAPSMGGAPSGGQPAATAEGGAETGGAAQPAGGGGPVRGTIKLADGVSAAGATLFITIRNQGMPDRGPPVAARRIGGPSFPAEFEIGPSDVMMQGLPFEGPFDIYVRLDGDGNAMTKEPGDLVNAQAKSGVMPGATGVEIVLDKRL